MRMLQIFFFFFLLDSLIFKVKGRRSQQNSIFVAEKC
jgi:hypothetical protein